MSHPLSLTGRRWRLLPTEPPRAAELAQRFQLPLPAARCLLRRASGSQLDAWMTPSVDQLHDPYAMAGMDRAVARIRQAVSAGERIRIVTDYDVDGTTSSLILQGTLRLLGAGAALSYHIPDRFEEGYGFSVRAAEQAVADGVGLLVTADIGVRDHEAVRTAAAGGVDVIVCDHHLPGGEAVPEAAHVVLCPPQDGCDYPNPALAACGVSLKLAQALLSEHPKRAAILRSMLKIAAIGTVADVVDLGTIENRTIVALGLEALSEGRHTPGLAALLDVAGLGDGPIRADDLGFRIGPRINAAGRLESADAVIRLFDERDAARAAQKAQALDQLNGERRAIQERLVTAALARLPDPPPGFVVVSGEESEGWHRGVVGIVASRIRDKVHRPVAVVSIQGETAVASVRSVPQVHAVRALDACQDLLVRYGGHPVAAGFTVPTALLPALSERLAAWVDEHADAEDMRPELELDAACTPRDIDRALAASLERLAPFGKGNPAPLLRVDGVRAHDVRVLKDKHLKFRASGVDAIWFNAAAHRGALESGALDLAARVELNRWRGRETVQLRVEDARPAAPPSS
jgi:single-stranded-DNA-specific exonuclease